MVKNYSWQRISLATSILCKENQQYDSNEVITKKKVNGNPMFKCNCCFWTPWKDYIVHKDSLCSKCALSKRSL